jgi:DNA-binding NarL/FixJ family response regulator
LAPSDRRGANRALQAGAAGYVGKDALPEQVLAAIRGVAAGDNDIEHDASSTTTAS